MVKVYSTKMVTSHIQANTIPNCISYDPTFAYELAVIMQDGIRRMQWWEPRERLLLPNSNERELRNASNARRRWIAYQHQGCILQAWICYHAGAKGKVQLQWALVLSWTKRVKPLVQQLKRCMA